MTLLLTHRDEETSLLARFSPVAQSRHGWPPRNLIDHIRRDTALVGLSMLGRLL